MQVTWYEAKWFCELRNSTLIQPKTEHKHHRIIDYLKYKEESKNFWGGGYFDGTDWHWVDGSQLVLNSTQVALTE